MRSEAEMTTRSGLAKSLDEQEAQTKTQSANLAQLRDQIVQAERDQAEVSHKIEVAGGEIKKAEEDRDAWRRQLEIRGGPPMSPPQPENKDADLAHKMMDPATRYDARIQTIYQLLRDNKPEQVQAFLNVASMPGEWEWDFLNYWMKTKKVPLIRADEKIDPIPVGSYLSPFYVVRKQDGFHFAHQAQVFPEVISTEFNRALFNHCFSQSFQVVDEALFVISNGVRRKLPIDSSVFKISQIESNPFRLVVLQKAANGRALLRFFEILQNPDSNQPARFLKAVELTKKTHGVDPATVKLLTLESSSIICSDPENPALIFDHESHFVKASCSLLNYHPLGKSRQNGLVHLSKGRLFHCNEKGDGNRDIAPQLREEIRRILLINKNRAIVQTSANDILVIRIEDGVALLKLDAGLRQRLADGTPDMTAPCIADLNDDPVPSFDGELYFAGANAFLLPTIVRPLESGPKRRTAGLAPGAKRPF